MKPKERDELLVRLDQKMDDVSSKLDRHREVLDIHRQQISDTSVKIEGHATSLTWIWGVGATCIGGVGSVLFYLLTR